MKYSKVIHYRLIKHTETVDAIEPYYVQRRAWLFWQWVGGTYQTIESAMEACRANAGPEALIVLRWTSEILVQPEPVSGLRAAMADALKQFLES